jgi:hypothetical protein
MFERFRRHGRKSDLEVRLRAIRAEPRHVFVRDLSERMIGSAETRSRRPLSRLAFAGGLITLMVGMFASFGGLGYAASGADNAYKAVTKLATSHHVTVHHSAARAQYPGNPPKTTVVAAAHEPQTASGVAAESAVAAAAQSGSLPFTGFSLLATVLISAALIASGLLLRRRERSDSR